MTDVENILGSTKPDVLTGDDAINYLNGRTNDDIIVGNGGDDMLVASRATTRSTVATVRT